VDHPAPPALVHTLTEVARSGLEATRLALELPGLVQSAPRGDGHPVVTLPGYGGGDASMAVVRGFLRRIGYSARGLGLGTNVEPAVERIRSVDDALAFRQRMAARVAERIRRIGAETGDRVSLVGWSMGGLYALDAARAEPTLVRRVVTFGAPFGDPRGTSLFGLLRWWSGSDVPVDAQDFGAWLSRSDLGDNGVPIKIVYSPRDGIVSPRIARLPDHPSVECIAIDSSHLGFGINPVALRHLARLLRD
jgi:pimeloyl-ACP methyl ester carboxylesterase